MDRGEMRPPQLRLMKQEGPVHGGLVGRDEALTLSFVRTGEPKKSFQHRLSHLSLLMVNVNNQYLALK